MNRAHEETAGLGTISVIETTAGQGTTLGYRFEEIAEIIRQIDDKSRVAVCLDTCHVFAAGYDIASEQGYRDTFEEFDALIGLEKLVLFHLNDSKTAFGSRVDRHEHIGKGTIGEGAFRMLMADERFVDVPKVIETPKGGKDFEMDIENVALLRSFVPTGISSTKEQKPTKRTGKKKNETTTKKTGRAGGSGIAEESDGKATATRS
jgi:deoxyribonuclease IV